VLLCSLPAFVNHAMGNHPGCARLTTSSSLAMIHA
jgi:hypothetical protein